MIASLHQCIAPSSLISASVSKYVSSIVAVSAQPRISSSVFVPTTARKSALPAGSTTTLGRPVRLLALAESAIASGFVVYSNHSSSVSSLKNWRLPRSSSSWIATRVVESSLRLA